MGDKDFFLSPDDSMTMGDVDYMRKSVRIKHKFPKTASNKGGFSEESEVSAQSNRKNAFEKSSQKSNQNTNASFNPTPTTPTQFEQPAQSNFKAAQPEPAPEERRQADNNLDMFRNMAKKMRGGR
ncbi:MAG: hypothetical protein AAFQ80_20650 [Cyanobacteria bacterium J06621_8]